MSRASRRGFWSLGRAEARGHAIVLAAVLWTGAAALLFGTSGRVDLLGGLKGADFVHFYTLGRVALEGDVTMLYDRRALHEFQTMLVPEAASSVFQPVYAPQTALLFAPFALLPYGGALALWAVATMLGYAAAVAVAWRHWRTALPDRTLVIAAAAGFPPFWNLVLHGQTTLVPILAFLAAWIALERGHRLLAGVALGLLTIKPQLGLVLAVVVLACGEWAMLAGAALSVAAQAGLVVGLLGPGAMSAYWHALVELPQVAGLLEPRPYQLHSIRAVTRLLPEPANTIAWGALAALVAWQAVRVWRGGAPLAVRVAVLVVASVLVSPHLTVYDAAVLAMPLVLLGGWIESRALEPLSRRFWPLVYGLVVAYLVPVALLIAVQPSVFLLLWLFAIVSRAAMRST